MAAKMTKIPLNKPGTKRIQITIIIIMIALFFAAIYYLSIDMGKFIERLGNVPEVVARMMGIDFAVIPDMISGSLITLFLTVISVTFSMIVSFVLAFLAAENITPSLWLSKAIKGIVAIIRSIPSLVLGLVIVASIGFGNTSAIVAIIISGIGYLTKAFSSTIENAGDDVIEAMRSTGATWWGVVIHGLIPVVFTGFMSWVTVEIEQAVSLSISLGMLGIAGIGLQLSQAQQRYQYHTMTTIIIYIFLIMFVMEIITTRTREKISHNG